MGNKTRNTGNLVSDTNIFVDISNDRVGIGSTQPTAKLEVAGTLNVTGVSTFGSVYFGGGTGLGIGTNSSQSLVQSIGLNEFIIRSMNTGAVNGELKLWSDTITLFKDGGSETMVKATADGPVELYYNNSKKLETTNTGSIVTGILTATSFSGDGSALTGVTSTTAEWTLGANGTSDYTFTGPGVAAGAQDPTIYLVRGQKYKFKNRTGSHPFRIQYEFQNTSGTAYTDGISISDGSSASSGAGNDADLYWEVRNNAPDLLHYQCTSHTNMSGRVVILGDVVTTGSWTASAGTPQTIDTIAGIANNAIRTTEYTVHIENGSNMQAQKVLVMQDGTTAYSQEYGIMHKSGLLVSMSADINSGNLRLIATPEAGVSGVTTYRITRQSMR